MDTESFCLRFHGRALRAPRRDGPLDVRGRHRPAWPRPSAEPLCQAAQREPRLGQDRYSWAACRRGAPSAQCPSGWWLSPVTAVSGPDASPRALAQWSPRALGVRVPTAPRGGPSRLERACFRAFVLSWPHLPRGPDCLWPARCVPAGAQGAGLVRGPCHHPTRPAGLSEAETGSVFVYCHRGSTGPPA